MLFPESRRAEKETIDLRQKESRECERKDDNGEEDDEPFLNPARISCRKPKHSGA